MDKNYYMNQKIGDSGIAQTQNPSYLTDKYEPFKLSPRKINVGDYFESDSKYDETIGDVNAAIEEGLTVDDLRARQQGVLDMIGNALVNNVVIAGTTAISGTLGIIDGLAEAAATGEAERIWNNKINNWAVDQQNATRETFPIYRGTEYEDKSIWEKLGTGIFWADAFQNLGFTEGMIIPGMGVGALLSKTPKVSQMLISSFASSIGEGSIEAINTKNDEINNKLTIANQEYNKLVSNIESPLALSILNSEYKKDIQNIEEDANRAGNFVFGSNIVLLTLTNTLEFGKLFSRGFSTSKRLANTQTRLGSGLTKTSEGLYEGLSTGKEIAKATGKKLLDATSEGIEEIAQGIISKTPSLTEDYNQFNNSMFNPEHRELAANLWQGLGMSLSESMKDPRTAEEFASGFIIGIFGVPMLRASKVPIKLENSIFSEVSEAKEKAQKTQQLANTINQRLADDKKINSYYNGLVRHLSMQERMNAALDKDDAFDYKTAESAQFISDIMMFDDIGDVDRLRDIINNSVDTSDEGIDNLIKETSKDGEGPFMQNGNPLSKEEVRNAIEEKKIVLNSKIDSYLEDKKSLTQFSPTLSDNAIKMSLYLKGQLRDYKDRLETVSDRGYAGVRDLIKAATTQNKNTTPNKILKGEGMYANVDGKRKLVRKEDIDYFDENGNPVFKNTEPEVSTLTSEDFYTKWSSDNSFREYVGNLLSDDSSAVPYDERVQLSKTLGDINRLSSAIFTYSKNLTDILSNPERADEINSKNVEEATIAYKNRQVEALSNYLKGVGSVSELDVRISNIDDKTYLNDALDKLEKEGDDYIKSIIEGKRELDSLKQSIDNILKNVPDSPEKESVNNILLDILYSSNNEKEFQQGVQDAIKNTPDFIAESLSEIMNKLSNHEDSKKSTKKDTNKPRKKVKKKGFSLSDVGDLKPDAEMLERGQERKDKKIDNRPTKEEESEDKEEEHKEVKEKKTYELDKKDIEKLLNSLSDEELKALADGKVIITGTPKDKINTIKKLAKAILDSRSNPDEANDSEGTNSEDNNAVPKRTEPYLRSWYHTKYSFNDLKNRGVRRAEIYNSDVVRALDDLDAFDFVDNGNLGILFNKNENLPIHYVKVKDDRLNDVIVLAIEVTNEVSKLVDTPKSFIAQDGKRYQAVGALGFDKNIKESVRSYAQLKDNIEDAYEEYLGSSSNSSTESTKPIDISELWHIIESGLKPLYDALDKSNSAKAKKVNREVLREELLKLTNITLKDYENGGRVEDIFTKANAAYYWNNRDSFSIRDLIGEISNFYKKYEKNKSSKSSSSRQESSNFYVYPKATNKIKHIYSGRMVKTLDDSTPTQRPLKEVAGKNPHLGVYYKRKMRTPTISEYEEVVSLNTNNFNPKEGSVWVFTMEADGRYYPKYVKVKRFTKDEYDIEEHKNTPLMKDLIENVRILTDSSLSNEDRYLAKYEIMNILHFPKDTRLLFNEDVVSISGFRNNIGKGLDANEKAEVLLELLQSDELNLRFQIAPAKLNEESYIKDVMDSDILTTDLAVLHNVNASFDLYTINPSGRINESKNENKKGHIGRRGVNNSISSTTLTLNGKQYSITEDEVKLGNKRITNSNTLEELKLLSQINNDEINSVEGNPKLYLGTYSSGEEFGIINGRVKKGKDLEKLKKEAFDKYKEINQKNILNDLMESGSDRKDLLKKAGYEIKSDDSKSSNTEDGAEEDDEELFEKSSLVELEKALGKLDNTNKEDSMGEEKPKKKKLKKLDSYVIEETEEKKEIKEVKKSVVMSDNFNQVEGKSAKSIREKASNPNFEQLVRANRKVLRDLGFKSVNEMVEFINNDNNKLPSIDTITNQESFDALVDIIKNCR